MNKFKFAAVAVAALTLGFTSCTNDDAPSIPTLKQGEPTAMGLTISTPSVPRTYASTDANATDDEIELKTVNVLIYSESSIPGNYILEKNASLNMSDFNPVSGTPDTYELKAASRISTTTGSKKIYVAMNYPSGGSFPAVNTPLSDLSALIHTLTSATELSSNGIAMFSKEATSATLIAETTPGTTPTDNQVKASVKRMVAKVTVREKIARVGGKIIAQGGELTDLEFALGNANKEIYPLQKQVGAAPSIVIQDPNWSSYTTGDFFAISDYTSTSSEYYPVDDMTKDALTAQAVYAPENTAQSFVINGENLTYISVRAKYAPEFYCDADGKKTTAGIAGTSFWTVAAADGSLYYFDDETNADTFAAANAGSIKSGEYIDGLCYFRAYINKNGAADTDFAAARYDVLRNNYYDMVINSIKAPGAATDKGDATEETSLMVDIAVEPWVVVSDDYDL